MRTHMKALVVVLAVAVLFTVVGCGTREEPKPVVGEGLRAVMVGKKWAVESLFARRVTGELTMEFLSDGTVKAFAGCNELTGTYTLLDDGLTFGPMASAGKSCGPVLDEQEYSFKTFLARIERARLDGDDLLLLSREFPEPIRLTTGGGGLFW